MEALAATFNQILNTSVCDKEHKGSACEHCGEFIKSMEITVPELGIKRYVQPVCECVQKIEHARIKEAENRQRQTEIRRLFSISDLGERYKNCTIDNFIERPGTDGVYEAAARYIEEYPNWGADGLLFWGSPGNGKTTLMASIANDLADKGHNVVFQNFPKLLRRIRGTFNQGNKGSEQQIMKALLECDVLIIDEVGAEKLSEWVQEIFYSIIDGRYIEGRPTLLTTNLKPAELTERIGERTFDRLTEVAIMIENKGNSYRREIAKQKLGAYLSKS